MKYFLSLFFIFTCTSCTHVSYLWQATKGQLALYNHERPIEEVLKDSHTRGDVKEKLSWISEIKKFVEDELKVKATSNYRTYVDLKRPYVIWSLTAAESSELKLKTWSFPIVGSFPYLGFFDEKMALERKKEWDEKGYDTFIRGVTAYSTLGYLRDPLLSSMLSRRKEDLVNLLFHETMHSVLYLKDQGSFNEQVASYVGDYGERLWIRRKHGEASKELHSWNKDRKKRREFGALTRAFAEELKTFYKEKSAHPDFVEQKAKLFASFQRTLKENDFTRTAETISNNAALLAYLTYEDEQDLFDEVDLKCGSDLKNAVQYLKSFGEYYEKLPEKKSPQQELRTWFKDEPC